VSRFLTALQQIKGHSVPFTVYMIEIIVSYKIGKKYKLASVLKLP